MRLSEGEVGKEYVIDEIKTDDGTLLGHEIKCGTITPAEDITGEYAITFDKSFYSHVYTNTAYHFFLYRQNADYGGSSTIPRNSWVWLVMGRRAYNSDYAYGQYISNSGSQLNADYLSIIGDASQKNRVTIYCAASRKLAAEQTYNWIAIGAI